MKYRKKPVVIEAVVWKGDNLPEVLTFLEVTMPDTVFETEEDLCSDEPAKVVIPTLEGNMKACQGDFIIRGVKGELYPRKPDIFAATYEHVDGRSVIVLGSVVRAIEGRRRPKMTVESFGESGSVGCVFFEESGSGPFRCVYGADALEVVPA